MRQLIFLVALLVWGISIPQVVADTRQSIHESSSSADPGEIPQDKSPIKIGVILSFTGPGAVYSAALLNGLNLYLDQVHHRIGGRQVDLVAEDDNSTAGGGVKAFTKLTKQDHVDVVTGIIFGPIAMAVMPLAESNNIPLVVSNAGVNALTQRKRSPWVLRTSISSSQELQPFGEWVYKTLGYKRIVTCASGFQYGWEAVGGFQKAFEDAGGQIIQKLWIPVDANDYSTFIKDIRKDADAVFIIDIGVKANIKFPKQYKALGPGLPILSAGSTYDEAVLPDLGDDVIGAVTALSYSGALDTPANKRFVSAYRSRYKKEAASMFAERGYTSMMYIAHAIESLKGDVENKMKFLAALKSANITDSPRGPMKLDEFGNPIENIYVRRVEKVKGKLQNTVIYTFPNVSQFWKWTPEEYMNQPPFSQNYPPCRFCQDSSSK